jgi:type IV pilus assembly protein PilQ
MLPLALGSTTSSFVNSFFLQLQAAVTNGNAKILTDPTLVVQEGQTASVNLTQEVVTNFTQQVTAAGTSGLGTVTTTVEKGRAGLILGVKVDRIDDNGFIGLSVAPSISQPDGNQNVTLNGSTNLITLLSERRLESGQIRLRDGQTLVLSGIIQDQDRTNVSKVPILGDIPILGALFRRTERLNQRREVIVLVRRAFWTTAIAAPSATATPPPQQPSSSSTSLALANAKLEDISALLNSDLNFG